jgi:hypothetical protein
LEYATAENILQTYSLPDILDWNGLTEADVLCFLVEEEFLEIPNPRPVDIE